MNILLVNDDGIFTEGIFTLLQAAKKIPGATCYVCAPNQERTAAGHGITVRDHLDLDQWELEGAEEAYACSGTPADCTKIGIHFFRGKGIEIDLVLSGINHGANLGTDVIYSGTVSAALEAVIMGVPAIAFSVTSHEPKHFEAFDHLVQEVIEKVYGKMPKHTIVNVNVPDIPASQLKGIRVTKLGAREYKNKLVLRGIEMVEIDGKQAKRASYHYDVEEVRYQGLSEEIDVEGYQEGYVTISPVSYRMTDLAYKKELETIEFKL